MNKRAYDSSLARMAGNIAVGLVGRGYSDEEIAARAVKIGKAILAILEADAIRENGPENATSSPSGTE